MITAIRDLSVSPREWQAPGGWVGGWGDRVSEPHLSLQELLDCGWLGMSSSVWSLKENAGLHQGPTLSQLSMVKGTFCQNCVTKGEQGQVSGDWENGVRAEGTAAQRWAWRCHAQAPGHIPLWSCLISPPRPRTRLPAPFHHSQPGSQSGLNSCKLDVVTPLCKAPSDPPLFLERHCSEVRAGVLSKAPWYQSSFVHQLCYIEKVLSSSVKWGLLALSTSNNHLNSCEEVMSCHHAQRYLHSAWHMLRTVRLLTVGKGCLG